MASANPGHYFSYGSSGSYTSGDYNRRVRGINANYDYLVENLNGEAILDRLNPYFTRDLNLNLEGVLNNFDRNKRLVAFVKQNVSSQIYPAFMNAIASLHPDISTKLQEGDYEHLFLGPMSDSSGYSSGEYENRSNLLRKNFDILVDEMDYELIADAVLPNLNVQYRIEPRNRLSTEDRARHLINIIIQNVSEEKIFAAFMNTMSTRQPALYEKIETDFHRVNNIRHNKPGDERDLPSSEPHRSVPCYTPGNESIAHHGKRKYNTMESGRPLEQESQWWNGLEEPKRREVFNVMKNLESRTDTIEEPLRHDGTEDRVTVQTIRELELSKEGSVSEINMMKYQLSESDANRIPQVLNKQGNISSIKLLALQLLQQSMSNILQSMEKLISLNTIAVCNFPYMDACVEPLTEFLKSKRLISDLTLDRSKLSIRNWQVIVQPFCNMRNLTTLSLNGCGLGDHGATALYHCLCSNTNLQRFCLDQNEITDFGLAGLSNFASNKKSLENISFAGNQISDSSAESIGTLIFNLRRLCVVDLSDNQIGSYGANIITNNSQCWRQPHHVKLDKNQIGKDALIWRSPHGNISVKSNTTGRRRINAIAQRLGDGELFKVINLNRVHLQDSDIEELNNLLLGLQGSLRLLYLEENRLTSECLHVLIEIYHRNNQLESILLKGNADIHDTFIDIFTKALKESRGGAGPGPFYLHPRFWQIIQACRDGTLYIEDTELSNSCIPILFRINKLQPLRELHFVDCKLSVHDLAEITNHIKMNIDEAEEISFIGNSWCSDEIQKLASSFEDKEVIGHVFGRRKGIGHNIKRFCIRRNGLKGKDVRAITSTVLQSGSLTHVDLGENDLGRIGAKALQDWLKNATRVTSLNISNNNIMDHEEESSKNRKRFGRLASRDTLRNLSLAYNSLDAYDLMDMVDVMTLEFLDFDGNEIGKPDKYFQGFCAALQKRGHLTFLKLSGCSMTTEQLNYLLTCLRQKNNLKKLDLSNNQFGFEGVVSTIKEFWTLSITHLDVSKQLGKINWRLTNLQDLFTGLTRRTTPVMFLGLRELNLFLAEGKAFTTAIGECNNRLGSVLKGKLNSVVLDLSNNHIENGPETRQLVALRRKYGSPRCVFGNNTGSSDFFDRPI